MVEEEDQSTVLPTEILIYIKKSVWTFLWVIKKLVEGTRILEKSSGQRGVG